MTARAPSRRVLFGDDHDRARYLELLAKEVAERGWVLLTYCQMTNHLHLLVRTPEPNLSEGMKSLHEEFARHINRKYAEHGHVFGSRFYNKLVRTEHHLRGCLRYIARNPVDAGLCDVPAAWRWSAHRALAGFEPAPGFLDVRAAHELLATDPSAARTTYLRLTAASDQELLTELRKAHPNDWLVYAADCFAIPIPELMRFLRASRSSVFRALAKARDRAA